MKNLGSSNNFLEGNLGFKAECLFLNCADVSGLLIYSILWVFFCFGLCFCVSLKARRVCLRGR